MSLLHAISVKSHTWGDYSDIFYSALSTLYLAILITYILLVLFYMHSFYSSLTCVCQFLFSNKITIFSYNNRFSMKLHQFVLLYLPYCIHSAVYLLLHIPYSINPTVYTQLYTLL